MNNFSQNKIPNFISNSFAKEGVLSESESKKIEEILNLSNQFQYPTANTHKSWLELKSQLGETKEESIKKATIVPLITRWAIAAVMVISIAFGLWKYNSRSMQNEFVYTSGKELKKFNLPDGSIITLNSFSKLITNDLSSDEREVKLIGEAFFEVNHNDKPFLVKTDRGLIHVTGTKFNVRNRVNLPFQIALAEGHVTFTSPKGKLALIPGEVITSKNESVFVKSSIKSATLSWLDSKLMFENETLLVIINTLENQYNIKFDYDKQLNDEKLTLTFDHLSASQAAELLSRTLNTKVDIK